MEQHTNIKELKPKAPNMNPQGERNLVQHSVSFLFQKNGNMPGLEHKSTEAEIPYMICLNTIDNSNLAYSCRTNTYETPGRHVAISLKLKSASGNPLQLTSVSGNPLKLTSVSGNLLMKGRLVMRIVLHISM